MKALVVAPQTIFSPRGTPFSVYYRTLVTAELGVKVDLLTYGEGQNVDIPNVRMIRIPRFRFLGSVKIGPSYLKLFLDIFLFIWTIGLLLKNRYDFVHAHEEAIFFCRILKPMFGFSLVYDMHSSLPQQLTNFKFTKSRLLIGLFKKLEDSCLNAADAIITICPDLGDYVNHLVLKDGNHLLIENSIFEPVKLTDNSFSKQAHTASFAGQIQEPLDLSMHGRLVVYAGTLEPYQGIDILIQAFKRVKEEIPDAFLIIVGGTDDQVGFYWDIAENLGLQENILFTGRVPQHLAKHYCSLASVLMSPRSEGTNTPLKVYEQLASGIPLVATNIYSHTQVLNDDVAILVDPEPDAMADGIINAFSSKGTSERIAKNAARLYERKYSRPIYEDKMRRLLRILTACAE